MLRGIMPAISAPRFGSVGYREPYSLAGSQALGGSGWDQWSAGRNYDAYQERTYGPLNAQANLDLQKQQAMHEMGAFDRQADRDLQLELAKIKSGGDWRMGMQGNAFGLMRDILGKGYIDNNIHRMATGRYGDVQGKMNGLWGVLQNAANNGLSGNGDFNAAMSGLRDAAGNASELARTGGVGSDFGQMMSNARANYARLAEIANRGGLTAAEYDQNINAVGQEVQDQGNAAAAAAINNQLGAGSPLAAAAILSSNAKDRGKAQAGVRADLDRYQSDTRMQAHNAITNLVGMVANAQNQLGQNKVSGNNAWTNALQSMFTGINADQGMRMNALGQMAGLVGQGRGIASDLANIDMRLMPDFMKAALGDATRMIGQGGGGGGNFWEVKNRVGYRPNGNFFQERTTIPGGNWGGGQNTPWLRSTW